MKELLLLLLIITSLQAKNFTFTDQIGREVSIEVPVKKIVVMQHHSLDILAQLKSQDKVIATEKNILSDLGDYIKMMYPNIDKLPKPGDLQNYNLEEIIKLKPDIVIAASQANLKQLQLLEELGIKTAVISLRLEGKQENPQEPVLKNANLAYTNGLYDAINILANLVAKEDVAKELIDFCKESRRILNEKLKNVKTKLRVFVANENNKTYGNDKYVGVALENAKAINTAAKYFQGYKTYSFELLAKINPDVILVSDRYKNEYIKITNDEQYKVLNAVKNNKVLLLPYYTKQWGNPNTDSIALGELYLAYKFYPDLISKDLLKKRIEYFYKHFYGLDFNDEIN
ncbi:ABC transporter substrate-binding protein [Campylobacter canadensis]|uniref:ABC transporter substrate-binding protein n=1 Tax=Campylobacter canadensis TaxID=449520 RepID=UPI001554D1FF|nr:ABC transporter substrate-binding protein [Campylobacter canadensis]MBZ7994380.1 ABC transporter substrate-binding protein [Campylobacter canadensis]MBZ7996076.1 ABC transporter substrate-binding protein [Campylobacter canadensis]MBZ7999712.1 ABC transporter substrate-binding protein [Campylobacter canadensis]MBZ8001507.1 ABC transporter substrate-binding protein [Campylobacter canadensis]MBZ8003919.1 ABC transporter substrate-binding protein [Campylobacter canadensis]